MRHPRPVRSILVYTHGEVIGDAVIQLPFAAALKRAAPEATLTWLSNSYSTFGTVFKEMAAPIIDELLILPNHAMPWRDFLLRPPLLRDRSFDLIIDTERKWKRTLWLKRIRHRRFISTAAGGLFSSCRPPDGFSPHLFTRVMQMGTLGLGQTLHAVPLTLPNAAQWDAEAACILPGGTRYLGFVIGAGKPDKCWPLEQFVALAQHVSLQGATPVVFLGPQEQALAGRIRRDLPKAIPVCCTSPYLTIALGQRLSAAVANDSGGGHLLAAADTPLVTLFRLASVREKFLPTGNRVIALAPEDFDSKTMEEIPLDAVAQALSTLLQ